MATKYTERQRERLVERAYKWMDKGKSMRQAAERIKIPRSTLWDWLSKE